MSYLLSKLNKIDDYINKQKNNGLYTPNMRFLYKDVGDDFYKIPTSDYQDELYKGLSDAELDKLRFKGLDDIMDFFYDRADYLNIPKKDIYKPELIDIVDNSYLEKVLYDANR